MVISITGDDIFSYNWITQVTRIEFREISLSRTIVILPLVFISSLNCLCNHGGLDAREFGV